MNKIASEFKRLRDSAESEAAVLRANLLSEDSDIDFAKGLRMLREAEMALGVYTEVLEFETSPEVLMREYEARLQEALADSQRRLSMILESLELGYDTAVAEVGYQRAVSRSVVYAEVLGVISSEA